MPKQRFFNISEEKRKRIMEIAIKIIAEKGLEADVASIVRVAGIPRGSFYQYFEGIEDMIAFIITENRSNKEKYLSEFLVKAENMEFFDLYGRILLKSLELASIKSDVVKIMSHIYVSGNKGERYYEEEVIETKNVFTKLISKDIEQGKIRKDIDADELADVLVMFSTQIIAKDLFLLKRSISEIELKCSHFISMIRKGVELT